MTGPRLSGAFQTLLTGLLVGAVAGLLACDLDLPTAISYPWDRMPLVLLAAACGAWLWSTRFRLAATLTVVGLSVLWVAVAFGPVASWLCDGLVRRDPIRTADAVLVLGSDIQADGDPTATAENRLLRALELLNEREVRRLIVTELRPPKPSHAAIARERMRRLGLRAEVCAVGPVVNTHDEAVLVSQLCRERGWHRLLVVSSPLHTRRACATIERLGVEVVSTPSPETRFDLETLDRPGDRLMAFAAALHERIGLIVYRKRGWIG